jgi:hypothetical protein
VLGIHLLLRGSLAEGVVTNSERQRRAVFPAGGTVAWQLIPVTPQQLRLVPRAGCDAYCYHFEYDHERLRSEFSCVNRWAEQLQMASIAAYSNPPGSGLLSSRVKRIRLGQGPFSFPFPPDA